MATDPVPPDAAAEFVATFKRQLIPFVVHSVDPVLFEPENKEALKARIEDLVDEKLSSDKASLGSQLRTRLLDDVINDMVGYGPLELCLRDNAVTEIMVNGFDTIYVRRNGSLDRTPIRFATEQGYRRVIDRMLSAAGRRQDQLAASGNSGSAVVDFRLPDGSRVQVVDAPLCQNGPYLTIRKVSSATMGIAELVDLGTLSHSMALFLKGAVDVAANIIITGSAGSGKTTLLGAICGLIPDKERIITIEDSKELRLDHGHALRMETKGKTSVIRDVLLHCRGMSPDRVILGECRGDEALDLIQSMLGGTEGTMTTVNAAGTIAAISRLETMMLSSGQNLGPLNARRQIGSAIHLLVHISRLRDGTRKCISITEVLGMDEQEGGVVLQDIFRFETTGASEAAGGAQMGETRGQGVVPRIHATFTSMDLNIPEEIYHSVEHHNIPLAPDASEA
jgi:pilus assembly protein CpaF